MHLPSSDSSFTQVGVGLVGGLGEEGQELEMACTEAVFTQWLLCSLAARLWDEEQHARD